MPEPALVKFDNDRFYHLLAGEDERGGGALLYFNLPRPLALPAGSEREYPPMSQFAELARQQQGVHIDIEKPFWWDMPVWVALGLADSIELAHNHLWRGGMLANEAWGKPRDPVFYPAPRHRLLVPGHLLPSVELRTAHTAFRRQRLGRAGQSRGLQSGVRALRRRR